MKIKSKKIAAVVLAVSLFLSALSLCSITVYADDISYRIDYSNETITLERKSGGAVNYMYCPSATANAMAVKKLEAEKWYPIYGDTIDISKYIPSSENSEILFAFREADDFPNINGTYDTRILCVINSRPNISAADFKNSVKYDPQSETIMVSEYLRSGSGYDYQVGIGNWIKNNTDESIDVSSKYNYLGGTLLIRKSADENNYDPNLRSFASNEYKIKIPKSPNIPKVKINENTKKIIGIITGANGYAWSQYEDGDYTKFTEKTIDLKDFENKFWQLDDYDDTANIIDYVVLYIKVPSNDKRPSSPIQKLLIRKSLIPTDKTANGVFE